MAKVAVTVSPEIETPVDTRRVKSSPSEYENRPASGVTLSSSASSKTTVSVAPFIAALLNEGAVVSTGVALAAVLVPAKPVTGSFFMSASWSFPVAGSS